MTKLLVVVGVGYDEPQENMRRNLFKWDNFGILYNPHCFICTNSYGEGCASRSIPREIPFLCERDVEDVSSPSKIFKCLNCSYRIDSSNPLEHSYITITYKKYFKAVHLKCFRYCSTAMSFARVLEKQKKTGRNQTDRGHLIQWKDILAPDYQYYLYPLRNMTCRDCLRKDRGCHPTEHSWVCAQDLYFM